MRIQLLLCTLILALTGATSTTAQIYSEDFSAYPDGTTAPDDGSWSVVFTPPQSSYFEVRGNRFEGNDLDGEAIWETEEIDISGFTSVQFSLSAIDDDDLEGSDYLDVSYSLDGGASFTLIQNYNNLGSSSHTLVGDKPDDDDWGTVTVTQTGLSGASLIIQVAMDTNVEVVAFDDVLVESETVSPSVQFTAETLSGTEGQSVDITVQINNPDGNAVPVEVSFEAGSSTAESADLGGFNSTSLTFPADAEDGDTRDFTLSLDNDANAEGIETALFEISVTGGSATVGSPDQLELTIIDDDSPPVVINELDSNTPESGTDATEFVELYNPSSSSVSLDGLVLVFFNGNGDVSYRSIDLDGYTIDAGGYFVIGNPAVTGVSITFPNGTLQNGADAVALYLGNSSDFTNGVTPVTTVNLIDAIVYGTGDADDTGLLTGLGETTQYNEDENGNDSNESLQRVPDGTQDIGPALPTPNATNNNSVLPVELVSFEAVAGGASATLAWTTAAEESNAGFHVEHRRATSDDDENTTDQDAAFSALGFVEGRGTTSEVQSYRFQTGPLEAGRHVFRLRQVDFDGAVSYSGTVELAVASAMPEGFRLGAAYPNPFNPRSVFELEVAQSQRVEVSLFDVLGRRVAVLFEGVVESGVVQQVEIEGGSLPSGLYLYRAEGERFEATRQVSLIK